MIEKNKGISFSKFDENFQHLKIVNILELITVRRCLLNASHPTHREMLQNSNVRGRRNIGIYGNPQNDGKKQRDIPFKI